MDYTIELEVRENRMRLVKPYKPIIAGNSNYKILFHFDNTWKECRSKTANFVIQGNRIPVEFTGNECRIPIMPNATIFLVSLIASTTAGEVYTTSPFRLIIEKNPAYEELNKEDPYKSYYAMLLGIIEDFNNGDIYSKNSDHCLEADHAINADNSQNSEKAKNSDYATSAGHAESSDTADYATSAGHAESSEHSGTSTEAEHSKSSDSATEANHATSAGHADEAEHSLKSDNANHADEAEHSLKSDNANHADEAEHSVSADSAAEANHATSADTAAEATHSQNSETAENAKLADNAAMAERAKFADSATSAETARVADSSKTQVSKTGDEDISGVKNFKDNPKFNGENLVTLGAVSNPNLLINGDFRINQRRETSYSTVGKYTVDRWKLESGSVTVEDDGIVLNGTISQTFDNAPTGTLTASVDNSSGEVTCSYTYGVFKITAANVKVCWAKLEVGANATAFSPKPRPQELTDCQYYYRKVHIDNFFIYVNSKIYFDFHDIFMRVTPTLISHNLNDKENIRGAGQYIDKSKWTVKSAGISYNINAGLMFIYLETNLSLTQGQVYNTSLWSDQELDSEIY